MKFYVNTVTSIFLVVTWMMGIVYAAGMGGWHLFFSICFGPFYAWYLVTKNTMIYFGLIHGCF